MKFIYKGRLNEIEDLPVFSLPANAVSFDEPDNMEDLAKAAMPYHIPVVIFAALGILLKGIFHGKGLEWPTFLGFIACIPLSVVHEYIHACFFPRKANVYCYENIRKGFLCVTSDVGVSKWRFVFLSIAPFCILGIFPYLFWIFMPLGSYLGRTMMTIGIIMMLLSVGDLFNVKNTLVQVPSGAYIKLSGMKSYWYYPSEYEN